MCPNTPDGWSCIMLCIGGRTCPKGFEDCSQTVYQCVCCQRYDFGDEPGVLAHRECFEECQRTSNGG